MLVQREEQARQVISVLLQRLVKTTRNGATGGASPSPTKSEWDSAVFGKDGAGREVSGGLFLQIYGGRISDICG